MKLSTKGRYGLMAMYQLAQDYGQGPISLKYVAEKQGLSENYLEQLFSSLKKDGLLKSVRGAYGGYMLSRVPEKITVGEVLRSLEGQMSPSDCVADGSYDCSRDDRCATQWVLGQIKNSIDQVIDSITLMDMIKDNNGINTELEGD
ncbi:MAG: Rrf2 family transcriptional regulator, partial [Gudongella sp.]|nr:Rrf2 family transcriptional regulator [Gudongella sp.]